MPIMTYEEFATGVRNFILSKSSGQEIIVLFSIGAVLLVLLAIFVIYLRRKYLFEKRNTDTFNTDRIKEDLNNYPGFHKGLRRDEYPKDTKNTKEDKWGKIDDD